MIVHAVPSVDSDTGGPARSVPSLAAALKNENIRTSIWVDRHPDGDAVNNLSRLGLPFELGHAPTLLNCHLIHDHGLWLPFNHRVAELARLRAIPRIVSPRGMLEPWALNHKKWKKRIAWLLYQQRDLRSAVVLHATAESEADQFRALGLRHPIAVLPNGVDMPSLASRKWPRDNDQRRTAVFLSRIHPKKGLPMLVEAWATIRPSDWQMRVIGPDEGGHRAEVERLVASYGLCDSWSFHDAVDGEEKWRALTNADLFILPTFSENFGIAVAEALAAGTPVITTTGAPWQGLHQHQSGWWVLPDVHAIQSALQSAFQLSRAELKAMGERGRRWVEHSFTWPEIAKQMASVYSWVLGQGPKPDCVRIDMSQHIRKQSPVPSSCDASVAH